MMKKMLMSLDEERFEYMRYLPLGNKMLMAFEERYA